MKCNLLGVNISATTYEEVVEAVINAAKNSEPLAVSATAVHGVMEGVHSKKHAARLNSFDYLTPDGQPVRWALNLLHKTKLKDRVYGPKLMLLVCEKAAKEGLPIYLYGSTKEVLEPLENNLKAMFKGLKVAGSAASQFKVIDINEQNEVASKVKDSGARIVFVGLGCPRQEVFTWAMRERFSMPTLAVGAAFDFHAGLASEAPQWMQRFGLQWLHRLSKNPRRLWKRYLLLNPEYLWRVFMQLLGKKREAVAAAEPNGESIPA